MKLVLAGWGTVTLVSVGGAFWWARRAPVAPEPTIVVRPARAAVARHGRRG